MAAPEQFSLRWNNHTSHLVGVFGTLLQSESLVDVTLSCEGRSLRAHKLVLSACSPYFKSLFQDHVEPHPIVILKDVKFSELRSIIQFMYSGEVEIDKDDLDSLFSTAEGLMIRGLAGSRPNFASSSLHEPSAPARVTADAIGARKRSAPAAGGCSSLPPEPCDSGGEGGDEARAAGTVSPAAGRLPSPLTRLSNGGDSDCATKRLKRESESADENSNDVDVAGTTYLCPECGVSFHTQNQLQLHHSTAHTPQNPSPGATSGVTNAGSRGRRPASGGARVECGAGEREERAEAEERGMAVAPAAHSHSWPPQDGGTAGSGSGCSRLWEPTLRYMPAGGRFLSPLLSESSVLAGMMANLRPLVPDAAIRPLAAAPPPPHFAADAAAGGPLNLSSSAAAVDGADEPSLDEPSAPTTPTPTSDADTLVTCKVCTRVFETPAALREHASVHQGERPFRCHFCGKAFKFRHHLKDHCRIHTGERPFDCKICGKCFARSSILKTHAKIHRQEERRFDSPISLPLLAAPPISSAAAATGGITVADMSLPSLALLPTPPTAPVLVKEELSPDT